MAEALPAPWREVSRTPEKIFPGWPQDRPSDASPPPVRVEPVEARTAPLCSFDGRIKAIRTHEHGGAYASTRTRTCRVLHASGLILEAPDRRNG